jgi:polysaccharide export outer membrane protein
LRSREFFLKAPKAEPEWKLTARNISFQTAFDFVSLEILMNRLSVALVLSFIMLSFWINGAIAQQIQYEIGPGDVLEISVWKDESLSRTITVPPDGIISYPLIGELSTTSMTVSQLRKKITGLLAAYVPDATVTVILQEINSLKAYVIGKVIKPGQYPISLDTTVLQLLSNAGGLNPYAAEEKIHILRRRNNVLIKIGFDYAEILRGRNLDQNIVIKRGDVVVVP